MLARNDQANLQPTLNEGGDCAILTIFVTYCRKQPTISEVTDKLCHKLFQVAKISKLAIILDLLKVTKIIIILDLAKDRKLTSLKMLISPVMEGLRTSNLRSRYTSLKGLHRALHCMMQWRHYLIITWIWQIFISPVMDGLQLSNLDRKYIALIGVHWVLLQRC